MNIAKLLEATTTVALEGNTLILRDETSVLRYDLSNEMLLALKDWASDDTEQPGEFPNIHQADLLAEDEPIGWKMKKAGATGWCSPPTACLCKVRPEKTRCACNGRCASCYALICKLL